MVFSSLEFLTVFLPAVLLLYYILPKRLKNTTLLLFSLLFYAWGEPLYVTIMLLSITLNFLFGLGVHRTRENKKAQRLVLALSVAVNLLLLGVFKYTDFVLSSINAAFKTDLPMSEIALPIGISFFTFQAMSYVFDVYMKTAEVQYNILNFGLYISLFPQLIAGPIVRYADVAQQINKRSVTFESAESGIKRFIIGLSKKVLFANNIGYIWSEISELEQISAGSAWLGLIAFSLQIYFDFSGYSDMAIGLGKLFGFDFLENFDYPYISSSVTEFWRRWHISLGTWFREYVYIPLGGNRRGTARQIRNILIVWMLTGLWHGASWNFVLWGLYYGVILLLEKFLLKGILKKLPAALRHAYTLLAVIFGWLLFAFESVSDAREYFLSMFGKYSLADSSFIYTAASNAAIILIAALACTKLPSSAAKRLSDKFSKSRLFFVLELAFFALLAVLCIAYLVDNTYNPFIYFRF